MSSNIDYKTVGIAIFLSAVLSTGIILAVPQVQETLRGPQGEVGPPGELGPQGVQGIQGEMGLQGFDGLSIVGPQGVQGPKGVSGGLGPQGIQGIQGDQGPPGESYSVPTGMNYVLNMIWESEGVKIHKVVEFTISGKMGIVWWAFVNEGEEARYTVVIRGPGSEVNPISELGDQGEFYLDSFYLPIPGDYQIVLDSDRPITRAYIYIREWH